VEPGSDSLIGRQVADYRVESLLGRGGQGVVYLAEHIHLGRKVALKVLAAELAEDQSFRRRFLREARLAASLDHPNILDVYDAGESDGLLFVAVRLVRGSDLSAVIASGGPMPPGRAVELLEPVAHALDAAHDAGLVHRDVKPGNILVEPATGKREERVYLSDFGLSKPLLAQSDPLDSGRLTMAGYFVGTPDYAAPEQIEGRDVDGRVDIYSLGCVLYQCLVGQVPFPRDSLAGVMVAHMTEPPPRATDERPELPAAFDAIIARAMAKAPADRYPTADEMAAAMRSAAAQRARIAPAPPTMPVPVPGPVTPPPSISPAGPPTPSPVPPLPIPAAAGPPPGRAGGRRAGAIVAVVVGIAIVATIVLLFTRGGGSPKVLPTTGAGTTGPTTQPSVTGPTTGPSTGPPTPGPAALPGIETGPTPWPAETRHLSERMALIGMPPLGQEAVDVHIHQNLVVYVHGRRVVVPLIGQEHPGAADTFFAEIHTHAELGTIHVEAAKIRHYTLGDVFDVWGVRFSWGSSQANRCLGSYCDGVEGQIRVFLGGQPYVDDPTQLPLADQQVIVVTYGTLDELPDPIPSRFRYERPILGGAR
jgi:serine/threonine-protein kinase